MNEPVTPDVNNPVPYHTHDGINSPLIETGLQTVTEADLNLGDVTTGNVSITKHGLVPKLPDNAAKFFNGAGTYAGVTDANLSVSDVTTNNASTNAHGFLPKLSDVATEYFTGKGTWAKAVPINGTVAGQYASPKYSTTVTLDWNNGNVQYAPLGNGTNTFTFANPIDGGRYMLICKQPSSGAAGTCGWPATVLWVGGVAPTLTTANSQVDIITFVYDGTNGKYYGNYSLNY